MCGYNCESSAIKTIRLLLSVQYKEVNFSTVLYSRYDMFYFRL